MQGLNLFVFFHNDLLEGKVTTLSDFVVPHKNYQVKEPSSDLEKLLLKKMCKYAADAIALQCDREYNVSPGDPVPEKPRGTVLSLCTSEELEGLPTNNLDPERDFSVFDRLSKRPARNANKNFTAKNLKNDMILHQADPQLTTATKALRKKMDERDEAWYNLMKQRQAAHDQKKFEKSQNTYAYQNRVLAACKTWGGPFQSVAELTTALENADDNLKQKCVTNEITYYRLTHMSEFIVNKQLFRVRGIDHETKLANLKQILSSEEELATTRAGVVLPTNDEVLALMRAHDAATNTQIQDPQIPPTVNNLPPGFQRHPLDILVNCMVGVIWINRKRKHWFLGCITEYDHDNPDEAMVDHLERQDYNDETWKYPTDQDICSVDLIQIIPIKPVYDWEISARSQKLKLINHKDMADHVKGRKVPLE